MLNIFRKILDGIFPPPECVQRIQDLTSDKFREYYNLQKIDQVISLSSFQHEEIRAAITANKFHHHKQAARLLASLIAKWAEDFNLEKTIFVAIPLSVKRQKDRGYNQVTEILKEIPGDNLKIVELLKRTKHTVPQTSLPRAERLKNVLEAFTFAEQSLPPEIDTVVLVDDVTTTGATLESAGKTLKRGLGQHFKVINLAIAH